MKKLVIDVELGQEFLIDFTADEIENFNVLKELDIKESQKVAAKEAARQVLLDKLGITADEAKLLLGGN